MTFGKLELRVYLGVLLPILLASAFLFGRYFSVDRVTNDLRSTPISNSSALGDLPEHFKGDPVANAQDPNCPVPVKIYSDQKSWAVLLCTP